MPDMTAAEAYEQFLVPNVFEPWAALVIDAARLGRGESVLDIACGTGVAARHAAAAVGREGHVVGADIDEGMLAVARRYTPPATSAPIAWRQADALQLPFEDASFDAVLCFEGIQFMPDRGRALQQARRVLKQHGRLIGTLWGPLAENPGYEALAAGLSRFVSPEAGRLPPFSLTDPATIRALLAAAGFGGISVEPHRMTRPVPSGSAFIDWVAAGAPTTRHRLALLTDEVRDAFRDFVEQHLAPYRRDGHLEMPYMRHVIVASAA